jgi:glyoxylase-like metal-dependent hydrolase (beta-lactamase superfamily II)
MPDFHQPVEMIMEKKPRIATTSGCQEIAPGVFGMEVGKGVDRSNVYFVRSGSSWVLIDAASPHDDPVIRKTAQTLFGAKQAPAAILLTHDHPDHAGSVRELARIWDCPVYVHPAELPLTSIKDLATVEQYANPLDRWLILPLLRWMPRPRVAAMFANQSLKDVVRTYDPDAAVPDLPDWQCIPTPGHTPGHVSFFRARDRVLITGDALLTADLNSFPGFLRWGLRRNRQKISGPPWYSTWNWPAAKQSVARLAEVEPNVLACGHGAPMSGDGIAGELHAFADRLSRPDGN